MSETEIAAVAGPLHPLIMSSGQHAEAQRYQQAQLRTGGITALNHRARHVRYALHWDGDPDSARVAVAELEAAFLSSPPERNLSNTACALAQWRLAHGDTAVSPYIEGLRRWSAAAAAGTVATELSCADILVTWRAAVTGASDAPALIARLDSLLREWAWGSMLENEGNLILARLLEERGDDAGALRVLRRLPPMVVGWGPYGSTFVRERGRVADVQLVTNWRHRRTRTEVRRRASSRTGSTSPRSGPMPTATPAACGLRTSAIPRTTTAWWTASGRAPPTPTSRSTSA
jgi:hypothetical protein